ncbi:MAG: type III pantothenate kinase, partial [Prevotellaceae bacterium]|nr:type III pantothenate kinase [Prevotellaceae bacterium]
RGWAFIKRYAELPCIISSVRASDDEVAARIAQLLPHALPLTHETPLPITNSYSTPQTLGHDRLALAVAAATHEPHHNVLVVDMGTAITYDVVTIHGEYLGGNISPGIAMRFKALHANTGRLPLCEAADEWPLFGSSTNDAIVAGVMNGVMYEVMATINRHATRYQNVVSFITGGDAKYVASKLNTKTRVDFNLALFGLNAILDYNRAREQGGRRTKMKIKSHLKSEI